MEKIKDFIASYWFLASMVALAIMYYLLGARGRKIEELVSQLARQKLEGEIKAIEQKRNESKEGLDNATQNYETLKRRHGALLDRLGIKLGGAANKPDAP